MRFRRRDGSYLWTEATSRHVTADGQELWCRRSATSNSGAGPTTPSSAGRSRIRSRAWPTGLSSWTGCTRHSAASVEVTGVLAVFYLDLDRFKVINDSLGHRVGDTVLSKMAERLTHHLRPADTLARLGGDEFVDPGGGRGERAGRHRARNRVVEAGREPFQFGDEEYVCTLSVGSRGRPTPAARRRLLQEADLALYRAKDGGRDRVHVFDEELRTKAVGRMGIERMLLRAIEEERLVVEYQPILDLRTGHLAGAEALLRIRDLEAGLLYPDSFLDVAEETGLLIPMDEHVMSDAVQRAGEWDADIPAPTSARSRSMSPPAIWRTPSFPTWSSNSSTAKACHTPTCRSK